MANTKDTQHTPARYERWWDAWAGVCHEMLPAEQGWDLAGAVIQNGKTAVVVWRDATDGIVRVAIDQPMADVLVATDAGFLVTEWLRHALTRFRRRPGLTMVRIPRAMRNKRKRWLA